MLFAEIYSLLINHSNSLEKSTTNKKDKCYVLALEGGGDKGAYQSGALKGLVDSVPNKEVEWDVVTGVSVGALDAIAISVFDKGKESEAVEFLVQQWKDIKGKGDIYQSWWGGYIEGIFFKSGLYDTSPVKNKVSEIIKDKSIKRKFVCGATNFYTGVFETFDDKKLKKDEYVQAVTASGAYPVVFPVVDFRGSTYIDGGVKINLDIASGINKCLDMGYDDEKIVVDVVMMNSSILPEISSPIHPIGVLIRYNQISAYDNSMKDLEFTVMSFPSVNFRYLVAPTKKLPSGSIPLKFSPEQIEQMIQMGIEDAINVVSNGEKNNFTNILLEIKEKKRKLYGRKETKPLVENHQTLEEDKESLGKKQEKNLKFLEYFSN